LKIPEHITVAGTVLRDEQGRYLMVQERQPQAYGLWNIPAGWVDEGETPQHAAVREASEEVGFEVELQDDTPIYQEENTERKRTYYAFLGRIIGGKLEIQKEELLDADWLELDKIEQLNDNGKIRSGWIIESIRRAENAHNRD
jgi:ADP-ribose pyrophosphatase YjhB (NUDIX family)